MHIKLRHRWVIALASFSAILCWGTPVGFADDLKTPELLKTTLPLKVDMAWSYNPPGFGVVAKLAVNKPYKEKFGMVWSHIQAGVFAFAAPALSRYGVHLEWMPIALFKIRTAYNFYLFHGIFGAVLNYDDTDVDFGYSDLRERKGEEEFTYAHRFSVRATIQGKWKFLIFLSETDAIWLNMDSKGPYSYFWDYNTLITPKDFIVNSRTNLLFELYSAKENRKFLLGPFYAIMYPKGTALRRQRVGLTAFYVPWESVPKLGTVRFFLNLVYNIEEPNMQNQVHVLGGLGTTWQLL